MFIAPHRRIAAALIAGSAFVLLTACSGSDGAATPPGGGGDAPGNSAYTAYRDCLAQNGVTLPSAEPRTRPSGEPRTRPSGAPPSGFPGGGRGFGMQKPDGVDDATWQKAQEACSSVRPSGRPGRSGGPGPGADSAYLNCLNDHGGSEAKGAQDACKVLKPSTAS